MALQTIIKRMSWPKRLLASGMITGALLVLALPFGVLAADEVRVESTIGVANVTAGDNDYAPAVNAKTNEVVKVQVYYRNAEADDSGKIAQNVRMKLALPSAAGKAQNIKAAVSADNASTVNEQVAVNLDTDAGTLQYIPGTATWKHNTGTATAANYVEEKVSDDVVNGAQGIVLENAKPGNFSATVTVLARVMAPGVKVTKQVELKADANKWADTNTAQPGDTVRYLIGYQNVGNITQTNVLVRDTLPAHVTIVPGTTKLSNTANPNGQAVDGDAIVGDGITIGNYGAGANAYVTFEAKIDDAANLACNNNDLRNLATVQPEGMAGYTADAVTTVKRDCSNNPGPNPTPTPAPAAAYSCDLLVLTKGDNRKLTAKIDYTAKNGATLKTVTYNFGDASQALTTDKTTVDHTYTKDGTYSVTATLLVSVNGKDQTTTSAACAQSVTFGAAGPTAPTDSNLPNTGPGDVVALFVGATVVGAGLHHMASRRRLARR